MSDREERLDRPDEEPGIERVLHFRRRRRQLLASGNVISTGKADSGIYLTDEQWDEVEQALLTFARLEAERDAQEKVLAKANACAAMLLDVRQGKRSEDDWRIGEALDEWIWASEAALASPSAEGQSAGREA